MHPAIPVKLKVHSLNKTVITYMGLDFWCSNVYIKPEIISELGCKGVDKMVTMTTMHHKNSTTKSRVVHDIEVYDLEENNMDLSQVQVKFRRKIFILNLNLIKKSSLKLPKDFNIRTYTIFSFQIVL